MTPSPPVRRPAQPKYQLVFENLRREILSGHYQAGERIPSEAHLEKRFGASRITIGRAVRDLCHQGLVERRAGSGTFVRAKEEAGREKKALFFGLIIPDLGRTDIFEFICQGLAEAPHAEEHALLWCNAMPGTPGTGTLERAWQICQQCIARQVAGVFFAPIEEAGEITAAEREGMNAKILAALKAAEIPVLLLDRDAVSFPGRSGHDLVGLDNWRAGMLAANHLLGLGSRRPVFLCSRERVASSVEERIAGFRAAIAGAGLACETEHIQRVDLEDEKSIREMMEAVRPDAIVCANDRTAGRLMQVLLGLGIRIPQDVRIMGVDDIPFAGFFSVPLSTLHQPCREIGQVAMQTMLERLKRPEMPARRISLEATLVVRDSCGGKMTAGDEREFLVE